MGHYIKHKQNYWERKVLNQNGGFDTKLLKSILTLADIVICSSEDQDSYIRFISDKVGYPPDTPLSAIDPQDLVSAIAMMEGTIDSTDFAPSLDELEVKSNRNVLDSIIQRGFIPIDQDSIRRQNIQQQNYRNKLRGYIR